MTKFYKWFVWNPVFQSYLAIEGLYPYSRAEYEQRFGAHTLALHGLSKSFSIPFFN